jgi:hypothetical protein
MKTGSCGASVRPLARNQETLATFSFRPLGRALAERLYRRQKSVLELIRTQIMCGRRSWQAAGASQNELAGHHNLKSWFVRRCNLFEEQ